MKNLMEVWSQYISFIACGIVEVPYHITNPKKTKEFCITLMHDVALPEGWFSSQKSSGWFCHRAIRPVFLNASLDSSNLNQKS